MLSFISSRAIAPPPVQLIRHGNIINAHAHRQSALLAARPSPCQHAWLSFTMALAGFMQLGRWQDVNDNDGVGVGWGM